MLAPLWSEMPGVSTKQTRREINTKWEGRQAKARGVEENSRRDVNGAGGAVSFKILRRGNIKAVLWKFLPEASNSVVE